MIVVISGVYQVKIDSEQQKVSVLGNVDYATLLKKLDKAGKHAELWPQKSNQNHKHKNNADDKKPIQSLKNKENDDEMQLLMNKINHLALLNHQAEANAKKGNAAANGGNKAAAKKGNSSTLIDQKANTHTHNDISSMMNLAGFHGGNNGGFQVQPNNFLPFQGMAAGNTYNPSPPFMSRHGLQVQPQMLYNRSPFVPSTTGYYYGYGPPSPAVPYDGVHHATNAHDDNTGSCMIM